ncbi:histidine kinase [Brevibacillus sp. SKDU10]|uniref:sensor histidine kinase n=1 Tax=Brevibacillus sp. SKDU10 TaxID=1247872 RepID=UPI0007C8B701|nr:HAMP domain-containing sensor histidine kinase [Brevibacillus sp. SKDU10]OAJ75552.1 histidine kinase [Brevibacillus sp. SKDU10]
MKKWLKPKKSRSLYTSLILDYFVFNFFLLVVLIGLAIYLLNVTFNHIESMDIVDVKIEAANYKQEDQRKELLPHLKSIGGWLEHLNANKQLVRVYGNKLDDRKSYSENQLFELLQNHEQQPYYYSMYQNALDSKTPYLLLKIPRNNILVSKDLKQIDIFDPFAKSFMTYLAMFGFIMLIFIVLYIYWTARRIKAPLIIILDALKKMTDGDYSARIHLKAEHEFVQIRDTFNYMADVLEETRRENEILEKGKQRMLMDISHDLKTPITSIQGYAKALKEGMATDEERKQRYLEYIYQKSIRVNHLINNLFELLKLDAPDYRLHLRLEEITEFVRDMVVLHYTEMLDKQFHLQLDIPERELYLYFDRIQLTRVLSNLLVNAIKYNPAGTTMRISLSEEKYYVVIKIADNGIGISEDIKENIFEPFVRADSSRASEGGTGLGLSIAKRIVTKHGGTIKLTSTDTEATVFVIRLPKPLT